MNGNQVPNSTPNFMGFFLPTKPGAAMDDQGFLINVNGSRLPWSQLSSLQLPSNQPVNTTALLSPGSVPATPTTTPPEGTIVFNTTTQQMLMYTSAGWTNITGSTSTWAAVLAAGNSSGSTDVIIDQALQMPTAPTNTAYLLNVTNMAGVPTNLAALPGSLAFDTAGNSLYVFDGAAWAPLSAGGGSNWATTLAAGNTSGVNDAIMSAGQQIKFASGLRLGSNNVNAGVAAADALAIGGNAAAAGAAAIGIGVNTVASGSNSVAIGQSSQATFANSVAIGAGVVTTAAGEIVLGQASATTTINGKLQLPLAAPTNTTNLLSITTVPGVPVSAPRAGSLALDDTNQKLYMYTTASGWLDVAGTPATPTLAQVLAAGNSTGANNISIASPQEIAFVGSVRISGTSLATGATGANSVSVGPSAAAAAINSVAIGNSTSVDAAAQDTVVIGNASAAGAGIRCIAIGNSSLTGSGGYDIALGSAASTVSANGNKIAIGRSTVATGSNSIAIGTNANDGGFTQCVVIGQNSVATANNQFVLGHTATQVIAKNQFQMPLAELPTSTKLLNITSLTGAPTSVGVRPGSLALDDSTGALYAFSTPLGWIDVSSSAPTPTLASVLAAGNTTGANNIVVSAAQKLQYLAQINVEGPAGANTLSDSTHIAVGGNSTVIGTDAMSLGNQNSANGAGATVVGSTSTAAQSAVAVGQVCVAGLESVAVGVQANANTSGVAIGKLSNNGAFTNSVALGASATNTANNEIMLGTTSTTVNIPNAARLPNGVATGSTALLNITSMPGVPTSVGVRPGSLACDDTNRNLYMYTTASGWVQMNASVATPTLTAVLTAGNQTGANDIFISSSQNLRYNAGVRIGNNNVLPTSAATTGISIGAGTIGTGSNHVSIGTNATTSTFNNAIAIGNAATAGATASVALGTSASSAGSNSIALGGNSNASSTRSTAVGNSALCLASDSTCIGASTACGTTSTSTTILGSQCSTPNGSTGCVVIGAVTTITTSATANVTLIGSATTCGGGAGNSVKVGSRGSIGTGGFNTGLGDFVTFTGTAASAVACGQNITIPTATTGVVAVGCAPTLTLVGSNATVVGYTAVGAASGVSILGAAASATGVDSVAIGRASQSTAAGSIATGSSATASAANTIAIGSSAVSSGSANVAIGNTASATVGVGQVSLGNAAQTAKSGGIAIGTASNAGDGDSNIAIGASASIGFGYTNSNVIGAASSCESNNCLIVGKSSTIVTTSEDNIVVGNSQTIPKNYANCVFVGHSQTLPSATINNSIFLGSSAAPITSFSDALFVNPSMATAGAMTALHYDSASGRIYPVTSSIRYKEDIRQPKQTERIYDVEVCDYKLKGSHCHCGGDCESKNCKRREIGTIAEEVYKIIPEVVVMSKDPETNEQRPETVLYDRLVLFLIPELKKLRDRVTELEEQLFQ